MTYSSMSQCEIEQAVCISGLPQGTALTAPCMPGPDEKWDMQRCERRAEGDSQSFDEESKDMKW